MKKSIFSHLLLLLAVMIASGISFANELDNPALVMNVQSVEEGTTVLRVDTRDNSVAMIYVKQIMGNKEEAKSLILSEASHFVNLPTNKILNELDTQGGISSWYFYWGSSYYYPNYPTYYNYFPTYCYYGNYYTPYYNYGQGYYNYYYYGYPGLYWR